MLSLEGGGGLAMGGLAMGVWLWGGGGFHREGRGVPQGGGGRGHFGPAAIYCTTTWCFTLKGLCTIRMQRLVWHQAPEIKMSLTGPPLLLGVLLAVKFLIQSQLKTELLPV